MQDIIKLHDHPIIALLGSITKCISKKLILKRMKAATKLRNVTYRDDKQYL